MRRNMRTNSRGPRRRIPGPSNIIVGAGGGGAGIVQPPANVELTVSNVTFNTNSGTTQDIDNDFGGDTLAAFMLHAHAVTSGTVVDDSGVSLGFTDATDHAMVGGLSEHGQATTDSQGYKNAGFCVGAFNEVGISPSSRATGSFYTGSPYGTRLTWDSSGAASNFIGGLLQIGGSNVSVNSVAEAVSATQDGTHAITGVGFAPDVVIALCGKSGGPSSNQVQHNVAGLGFAVRGGNQGSAASRSLDSQATSQVRNVISDSYFVSEINGFSPNYRHLEVTSWDSDGITVTARNAGNTNTEYFLFLKLADAADASVTPIDWPTSTGEQEYNVGFRPRVLIMVGNLQSAYDSGAIADGGLIVSLMGATDRTCSCWFESDNVGTSECKSVQTNKALKAVDGSGATLWEADLVEFTSTGFKLDFTTVQGAVDKAVVLGLR